MDDTTLAKVIAEAVASAIATATAAPAAAAPAAPRVASPFQRVAGGTSKADTRPEVVRYAEATFGRSAEARTYIAANAVPLYSCTAEAIYASPDGNVTGALHGFLYAKEPGSPCTGVSHVAKGTACPGKVRAS